MTSQESEQSPDYINLKLLFLGIDGGNGGRGENGGDGGNGGNGKRSSDGPLHCRRGGGDGGNGGLSGKGGQGGDGGNGGNGADIIFIGSESALDVLSYSIILNTGGGSGTLGRPGALGLPGRGGAAGSGSTFCHGGDRGRDGGSPIPTNEGTGQLGKDGEKGKVDRYKISELQGIIF